MDVTAPGADNYNALYKATATPTTATTENTAWTYDEIPVGSGILAQTRDSYVMEIELGQYLLSKKFEIGKAYTLTITVYGYEEIKIKTTLEGWIDGGPVTVEYD